MSAGGQETHTPPWRFSANLPPGSPTMITRPPPSSKRFSFTPETAPCTRCDSIIIRNNVRTIRVSPSQGPFSAGQLGSRIGAAFKRMEAIGIEPTTPCVQSRCSTN